MRWMREGSVRSLWATSCRSASLTPAKAHLCTHQAIGVRQSDGSLEEDLRRVVAGEDRRVLLIAHVGTLRIEGALCNRQRRVAIVAKLDRRLGKRRIEPVEDDEQGDCRDAGAYGDEQPVAL